MRDYDRRSIPKGRQDFFNGRHLFKKQGKKINYGRKLLILKLTKRVLITGNRDPEPR